MKKTLFFAVSAILALACSKNLEQTSALPDLETQESAQIEFAKILSKAVYADEDLRVFLKEEAIKQFDNDYDVFYPFVKDETISGGRTFREILVEHAGSESKLQEIEEVLPLLTILVPDWSWLNEECFSANTWDTSSNDVCVGYNLEKNQHTLFNNGKIEGVLSLDQIPGFPVLIVKENERMKLASTQTKGTGPILYEFIDEVFDGSRSHQARAVRKDYYDRELSTETVNNLLPASKISPIVINAYNEFKNDYSAVHRDYIYYGMTSSNTTGTRNYHISESLVKFKFRESNNKGFFDGDYNLNVGEQVAKKNDFTDADLLRLFYGDGSLELYFYFTTVGKDGKINTTKRVFSVPFSKAFSLKKVHGCYEHKTWFSKAKWTYTADANCFTPKWIDANVYLPQWFIETQSSILGIHVEEYDPDQTFNKTISQDVSYMQNFDFDLDGSVDIGNDNTLASGGVKIGFGYGNQKQTNTSVNLTISTTIGSDDFGDASLTYMSPIISNSVLENGVRYYEIKTISTGILDLMILPVMD